MRTDLGRLVNQCPATAPHMLSPEPWPPTATDPNRVLVSEPEELVSIFTQFYQGISKSSVLQKARDVIKTYDHNGDGKLQFVEFVDMIHRGGFWNR